MSVFYTCIYFFYIFYLFLIYVFQLLPITSITLFWLATTVNSAVDSASNKDIIQTEQDATTSLEGKTDSSEFDRAKLFFGSFRTITDTYVSFTTGTVFMSCFVGYSSSTKQTPAPATTSTYICSGKKRKKRAVTGNLSRIPL